MATLDLLSFPAPENVDCPHCKATIKLYDPDGSEYCVCSSCKSFIRFTSSYSNGTVQKQVQPVKEKLLIPLGTEGILKDHTFKVIAYLERKEKGTTYSWKEYLLYNYSKGYATLAEYDGHWNFIVDKYWEPTLEKTYSDSVTATHQGVDYRIFNTYTPVTTALLGEFDWDVLSDNQKTYEYIAPPFMISREGSESKHAQYFWSEYTEAQEIADAFGLDIGLFPTKHGIGANETSYYLRNFDTLAKYTMLSIVAMLLLQLVIGAVKPSIELLDSDFNIEFDQRYGSLDSLSARSWTSGTFEFKPFLTSSFEQRNGDVPLEIVVGSDVDNNWMEASVILVNEQTNETWEVTKGVEYYHGYDGGEHWTEGSKESSIILSEIPEGKYHLNIYPASGDPNQTQMHIRVTSNITLWRNILLSIFVLSLYPIYCWFRMQNFEKQRWMNSDHSPYES